jgi:uncharacterized protein
VRRSSRLAHLTLWSVVIALLAGALGLQPASAQGTPVNTITVGGVGTATGRPDVASVELGLAVVNNSLDAAYTRASETTNAITQALLKLNIAPADIQTAKMTVSPTDRTDERNVPSGEFIFRVSSTLRVTIRNIAQVKQVLDAALSAGANSIDNLTYGIDDITPLEREARLQAVSNARARATDLADALGVAVGDPMNITETVTSSSSATPVTSGSRGAGIKSQANPGDNAGQLVVTVQIQVTFALKKR